MALSPRCSYTDASAWGSGSSTATIPRRSRGSSPSGSRSTRTSSTQARRTRPQGALDALPAASADVILLDTLGKPGDDTLLKQIRAVAPEAKVIVYSGYVRLMQEGALGDGRRRLLGKGRRRRTADRSDPLRRGLTARGVHPPSAPLRTAPTDCSPGCCRSSVKVCNGVSRCVSPRARRRSTPVREALGPDTPVELVEIDRNPARIIPFWREFVEANSRPGARRRRADLARSRRPPSWSSASSTSRC